MPSIEMSSSKWENQTNANNRIVLLIGDERSLLAASLLGCIELICRETAHYGRNKTLPWGGIPVVILMGDDGQLPAINYGAFEALNPPTKSTLLELHGFRIFKDMAQTVRNLSSLKRQDKNQSDI